MFFFALNSLVMLSKLKGAVWCRHGNHIFKKISKLALTSVLYRNVKILNL